MHTVLEEKRQSSVFCTILIPSEVAHLHRLCEKYLPDLLWVSLAPARQSHLFTIQVQHDVNAIVDQKQ